jgi:hypothetical protein
MQKYLLLFIIINSALGSWSSDNLSDDPWAFGKTMEASDYSRRPDNQENINPGDSASDIKATDIPHNLLRKSKTSLNLLADAKLASQSPSGSIKEIAATPQFERYTKYYYILDFVHRGITGEIIKLRINRNIPCTRTGEVYPAISRLEFKGREFTKLPSVFGQQSFEGPHDLYDVPYKGYSFNKFVIKIPTLVENLVNKTKDKPSAQIVFYKPDGQYQVVPLELESLTFDKP